MFRLSMTYFINGRINPRLDSVYLDHAGSTVPSKTLMQGFAAELSSVLYGNPHSGSTPSQLSTARVDDVRLQLLQLFNASTAQYDLVFVANATAGIKLVLEGMRSNSDTFRYAYHQACHTSVVGLREEATESVCFSDEDVQTILQGGSLFPEATEPLPTLYSYSAQSHLDGTQYPISWTHELKKHHRSGNAYTLLDCASYASTSPLNMSHPDFDADFVVLSLYKIFGFPDLGVLLVKHDAASVFNNRKYFGGGTVDLVVCSKENWSARKTTFLHERLEDGTLPFHNIVAAGIAIETHKRLYGSMCNVQQHTRYLTTRTHSALVALRHGNGLPVCHLYSNNLDERPAGPIIALNLKNQHGQWVSLEEFEKLAALKQIHARTGSACSPGGIAAALGLEPWELRQNFSAGFRCGMDSNMMNGKPAGIIRVSFGAMSTKADADAFVSFIKEFFTEQPTMDLQSQPTTTLTGLSLHLKSIIVYPIKSCGGFVVPDGMSWALQPEGLKWDREWCLVHQGSGQALNQKRYPRMALLKPVIDFEAGVLRVVFAGQGPRREVSVPLSADPTVFRGADNSIFSRVCGDVVSAQVYSSDDIHDFFSDIIGAPCFLARFPPGGQGHESRLSKLLNAFTNDSRGSRKQIPGSFPTDVPSPPESDSEQADAPKLLLSNESPILMVHSASIDALNETITAGGGQSVSPASFRANIILSGPESQAWSEDNWTSVSIGTQSFSVLAPCRRCQMVCVDQDTGEKRQEPYLTLAKTRRISGKVYFGMHMKHNSSSATGCPMIQVGDIVHTTS